MTSFKEYTHDVAYSTVGHALVVVRSLYLLVELEAIDGGFTWGTSKTQIENLEEEAMESATKLADDLNLFGNENNEGDSIFFFAKSILC